MLPKWLVGFTFVTALTSCSLLVVTSGLDDGLADTMAHDASDAGYFDDVGTIDSSLEDAGVADSGAGYIWEQNGHRYEFVRYSQSVTWLQARSQAIEAGAYLVSITSAEEDAFLASVMASNLDALPDTFGPWIGAYQPEALSDSGVVSNEPAGGWAWTSGEPWEYTNWGPSEPSNSGGNEDFVHMRTDGLWNDTTLAGAARVTSAIYEYE